MIPFENEFELDDELEHVDKVGEGNGLVECKMFLLVSKIRPLVLLESYF